MHDLQLFDGNGERLLENWLKVSWFHCFLVSKCRSSRELVDDSSGNASPSDSVSSIPSCMPFSWFGDRERSRDREREKEQSLSSSSLPHSPTEDGTGQRNKVRNLFIVTPNLIWNNRYYDIAVQPFFFFCTCTVNVSIHPAILLCDRWTLISCVCETD